MNNKEAVAALRKFEDFVAPVLAMKDVLSQVEVAERDLKDFSVRKENAAKDLAAAEHKVKEKLAELELLRANAAKTIEQARGTANGIIDTARKEADSLIKEARGIKDAASMSFDAKKKELADLEAAGVAIKNDIVKAKAELRETVDQRENVLASLRKLVGSK
jgi:cell division septum initiation protein DivIVA